MTPCEGWAKEKPRVGHLCDFGYDAYVHIPQDERQKLDPKTRCIFWDMVNRQKRTNSMT